MLTGLASVKPLALLPFPRTVPREKGKDRREGDRIEEGDGEARHASALPARFGDGCEPLFASLAHKVSVRLCSRVVW